MRLPIHALAIVLVVCGCSFVDAQPVGGRFHIIRGADVDTAQRDMFSITELSSSVFMEEVGGKTRGQVDRVDQFLKIKQWSDVVDMLIRLTEYQGNKLIAPRSSGKDGYVRYVSVRDFVNERLTALSGRARQVLIQYRQRVDPLAQQLYDQALANRDTGLLQRIWVRRSAVT